MQNVVVNRYRNTHHGWAGTVESENRSWILFVPEDGGSPHLMVHRDVSPDEAKERDLSPGVRGEYVTVDELGELDEKPTPNLPVKEYDYKLQHE